jgi:hypothetical protein
MDPLQNYVGQELMWTPLSVSGREHKLRAGDTVLARLVRPSLWRERRIGTAANGSWAFARAGFWRTRVVVTDQQSGAEVASLARSGWSGKGTLALPDGRQYRWRNGNLWGSKWAWLDGADQPLMRFKQSGAFKVRCAVIIEPPAAGDPHLTLLAMLGWYLMLLTQADAAAASSAVVASGA